MELETHFLLARALGYVGAPDGAVFFRMSDSVSRMLSGLSKRLRNMPPAPHAPRPAPRS